jgi:hypothetical protein
MSSAASDVEEPLTRLRRDQFDNSAALRLNLWRLVERRDPARDWIVIADDICCDFRSIPDLGASQGARCPFALRDRRAAGTRV